MHLYMKYTQPLFIQGIMPLKSLFDSKVRPSLCSFVCRKQAILMYKRVEVQILKIHLFGQPATGDLKRPFEAPAGMFGTPAASSSNETTETPAVEAKKEAKKDK